MAKCSHDINSSHQQLSYYSHLRADLTSVKCIGMAVEGDVDAASPAAFADKGGAAVGAAGAVEVPAAEAVSVAEKPWGSVGAVGAVGIPGVAFEPSWQQKVLPWHRIGGWGLSGKSYQRVSCMRARGVCVL